MDGVNNASIISRVVEAERQAQEMVAEAKKRLDGSQDAILSETEAMREKFDLRVRRRLGILAEQENDYRREQINRLQLGLEDSLKDLAALRQREGGGWTDTLVGLILDPDGL